MIGFVSPFHIQKESMLSQRLECTSIFPSLTSLTTSSRIQLYVNIFQFAIISCKNAFDKLFYLCCMAGTPSSGRCTLRSPHAVVRDKDKAHMESIQERTKQDNFCKLAAVADFTFLVSLV
jgi:hypothetical protein